MECSPKVFFGELVKTIISEEKKEKNYLLGRAHTHTHTQTTQRHLGQLTRSNYIIAKFNESSGNFGATQGTKYCFNE